MDLAVPSRFACLKIEDDDRRPFGSNSSKRRPDTKPTTVLKSKPAPKRGCVGGSQAAATTANKQSTTSTKKHKHKQGDKQWEEWKKIDSELINENFEQDMQDALLQSKLDYEAVKKSSTAKTSSKTLLVSSVNVNKKKKTKTMSLDQFLEGPEKNQQTDEIEDEETRAQRDKDNETFFEKLMEVAKQEMTKGRVEEERRERDINADKLVTIAQFQEQLQIERGHSAELERKLDEARLEIAAVKARNKTLCGILGQGEMREKADILLELERLSTVKDELTEEVGRLYKLLEQERSKSSSVADSQLSKHKDKVKILNKHKKNNGC